MPGMAGIPGITGINGKGDNKKAGLLERWKGFSPKKKLFYGAIVLALVYLLMDDMGEETNTPVKPKKPVASKVAPGERTFEMLTPEQKRFVERAHDLAFDYYKNKEYDKALFELAKIFQLLPDYKDSRELERYAKEGKRKLEQLEEERKKKEEEAKIQAQIAQLVDEARERMDKKQYAQANELFPQILALDPDNHDVAEWRKIVEQWQEEQRRKEEEKRVRAEINKQGWILYQEGMREKKRGKYHSAISMFGKILQMEVTSKKLAAAAKEGISQCKAIIKARRDPVMEEAKTAESAGELVKAFHLYEKVDRIDPGYQPAYLGMERLRGILHEQARVLYTEAVLEESYSDFDAAKKKFAECLDTSPPGDIYHERAQRKLAKYFQKEEAPKQ